MISASTEKKTISILGCGWYGLALAKALLNDGLRIKGSTTSPQKMSALVADGIEPHLVGFSRDVAKYDKEFFDCDILFIAIPPKTRSGEGGDYTYKIIRIIEAIKLHQVKNVIFISSTGVYADLNHEVDENTDPQPNTEAGKTLFAVENLFRAESSFKTTIIRFAGLIGPGRDPGRFFAGKKEIPNGDAPVNLIHLDDCIGLSKQIIAKDAFGYLFNGCAPQHPKRSAFYTQAALKSGFDKPEFVDELREWKIVKSVNIGDVLGYEYKCDL